MKGTDGYSVFHSGCAHTTTLCIMAAKALRYTVQAACVPSREPDCIISPRHAGRTAGNWPNWRCTTVP